MDKLQHFSKMLGIQNLDMPHLRERAAEKNNFCDDEAEQEPTEGERRVIEEDESETASLGNGNDEKKANEGLRNTQADLRGRRVRNQTGRGVRA